MRCKICEKTFRTPTKAMKEYLICNNCGRDRYPTKSQVKIGSKVEIRVVQGLEKGQIREGTIIRILTPGNWHYEGLMVDLEEGFRGRVQKVILEYDIHENRKKESVNYARLINYEANDVEKNSKENELKKLEEKYEKLRKTITQINLEINDLKIKEKQINDEINLEKKHQEERKGKGFSKIFSKFSKKNKPSEEYSKKYIFEKETELSEIRKQYSEKEFKKRKFEIELRKIEEEINKNNELIKEKMPKKKDELVDEAKKIQAELDALKKKKEIQKSLCKGTCQNFKVKKERGVGRYESGQVHCQTCDVWLDYRGCHKKNGQPAEEDSRGIRCNCCNFQVRAKPRGKESKERLSNKIAKKYEELTITNQNPCPGCGIMPTAENIESIFGLRMSNGKLIRQSRCYRCRSSTTQTKENTNSDVESISTINSENTDLEILNEVKQIILDHKHEKRHNLDIKTDLIDAFLNFNSIKKVSEITNQPEKIVREYIKSPKRLPAKLKQACDENILSSDPKLALNIAIHAVDHFNWDGENENQDKIYEFALKISQFFKDNISYKEQFLGSKKRTK